MRVLQVCNVGQMTGGTAACAWTITRALPECDHHLAFLSRPTDEVRAVLQPHVVHHWARVEDRLVGAIAPDLVILHNTSPARCELLSSTATLQYIHSAGTRMDADRTVVCSEWLRDACRGSRLLNAGGDLPVLHQGVPRPPRTLADERRELSESLIVGRLCTPTSAKWPASLVSFYDERSRRHPHVEWEFVGCPNSMIAPLRVACRGRARFHPAGWHSRSHLWRWHALLYHHPDLTESFGRTAAEAMRAGCVPIVDDRGGFREQIGPGTGWLCGTAEDFDQAITALRDRSCWRTVSERAGEHADRRFSIRSFRERLRGQLTALAAG